MQNLSVEITTTLGFLNRLRPYLQTMYKESLAVTNKVGAMRKEMDSYGGQVRTTVAKYRESIDKQFSMFNFDLQNFSLYMTDIIQNKHNDTVINILNRYAVLLKFYKLQKKNTQKLCDLIKIKKEIAERDSDYVKQIGMHKILIAVEKQNYLLDQIVKRLTVLIPE